MRYLFRLFTSFLVALCVTLPASAINTPLSDEAVREAYFLGQRHDGSYPSLMGNYIKRPPAPKSGPHIFSITFLTPFISLWQTPTVSSATTARSRPHSTTAVRQSSSASSLRSS